MKRLIALMAMLLLLVGTQSLMAKTIYFYNSSKWTDPYVYAWKANGSEKNHEFPGVRCTSVTTTKNGATVYAIDLEDEFTHVIFSNNRANQTGNLELVDGAYYNCTEQTTLEAIEIAAGVWNYDSYYFVGAKYINGSQVGSDNWNDRDLANNKDYKFTQVSKNLFSYTITCSESAELRFRLRKLVFGNSSFETNEFGVSPSETLKSNDRKGITEINPTSSAAYTAISMQRGYTYTIYYNASTKEISYSATEIDPASYAMVAKSQNTGKTFVMDMSMSRVRNSGGYDTDLWTAGFKSDLLPGAVGDKFDIYIKKTTSSAVTYINPNGSLGNNQVDDLRLDYTNLESVNNILYNESDAPTANNTFTLTKKKDYSYTVALNLGSKIERGYYTGSSWPLCEQTFISEANSMSLYVNQPLYKAYEKMYDGTSGKAKYDYKKSDFYLIGQLDAAHYCPSKEAGYTDARSNIYLMKRNIYYKPGTEEVDSIVYSKVVMKPAAGFDGLFLSFAPKELLDDAANGGKFWGYGIPNGNGGITDKEAYNYIARPELFDSRDATAQMGAVFFRGTMDDSFDKNRTTNGSQALNPLLTSEQASENEYYIVRLNITTSTYRIEFLKREPIEISENGIRTYCGQTNLRIPTDLKDKFHIYAVQDYVAPTTENVKYEEKQGQLKLRALDYIPANEPVVLVVKDVTLPCAFNLEVMSDIDDDYKVNPEDWWKQKSYEDSYKNYLVGVLSKDKTIENGEYDINEQGKYVYRARNFALNKFSNTKYFKTLYPTDEERQEFKDAGKDYYSFFRAKGTVKAGYAYLQLPSNVLTFDGQLLDHQEDDSDVKTFAKMSLFFDDVEGDVTGIEEVKTSGNAGVREDGAYYTLQGMKVEKPVKGLYIHNGKKVIIK